MEQRKSDLSERGAEDRVSGERQRAEDFLAIRECLRIFRDSMSASAFHPREVEEILDATRTNSLEEAYEKVQRLMEITEEEAAEHSELADGAEGNS